MQPFIGHIKVEKSIYIYIYIYIFFFETNEKSRSIGKIWKKTEKREERENCNVRLL